MINKKLVLLGTNRHAVCINDYYMFFSRTDHEIVHILYPIGTHKNRDWWEFGQREDKARDSIVDCMKSYKGDITVWSSFEDHIAPILDSIDFDYICLGNGSDPTHKAVINRYGREKVLFTEYGWLPWAKHFYISRQGAGFESEIARVSVEYLDSLSINSSEINKFHKSLDIGNDCTEEDFIYMPLQKDVNDFKFLYNDFSSNEEYLKFVDSIVPTDIKILVKSHPLYPKIYDLSFSKRMIDITHANINKHKLYTNMKAMICLNSTSILEALSYNKKVFSYGDDLYVGKDITHHKINDSYIFEKLLMKEEGNKRALKFVSLLMSRQIDRARCCANQNSSYINNHYWNKCI